MDTRHSSAKQREKHLPSRVNRVGPHPTPHPRKRASRRRFAGDDGGVEQKMIGEEDQPSHAIKPLDIWRPRETSYY